MRQKEMAYSSFGKIPVTRLRGERPNTAKRIYIKIKTMPSTIQPEVTLSLPRDFKGVADVLLAKKRCTATL